MSKAPGRHMQHEIAQAAGVFGATVLREIPKHQALTAFGDLRAIYTVARGSSDAVANILAYEFMASLSVPVTSLPPSVFSLGNGVDLSGAGLLIISQSGASDDLVAGARIARARGATVISVTNQPGSPVEMNSHLNIPILAGPEKAVPATKTVIGSIAAGMALLSALRPDYRRACEQAAATFDDPDGAVAKFDGSALARTIAESANIYVVGRGCGFGAALELALKLKETCALHAEAYSASEVLHGPLQLASSPILVLILDTGETAAKPSLDRAQGLFKKSGATVFRLSRADLCSADLTPMAAAALLVLAMYPVILQTAITLNHDPDAPDKLAKITRTT